jgi:hypothetical protein
MDSTLSSLGTALGPVTEDEPWHILEKVELLTPHCTPVPTLDSAVISDDFDLGSWPKAHLSQFFEKIEIVLVG